jgi:hypothetical protein
MRILLENPDLPERVRADDPAFVGENCLSVDLWAIGVARLSLAGLLPFVLRHGLWIAFFFSDAYGNSSPK